MQSVDESSFGQGDEGDEEDDDSYHSEEKRAAELSPEVEKRFQLIDENIFMQFHPQTSVDQANAFRISLEAQQHTKRNSATFCYSEVHSFAFLKLLISLQDYDIEFGDDAHFVDVGSGCGKTLVIASIINKFKRVVGIELNPGLFRKSQDVVKRFNSNYRTPIDLSDIELVFGDGTNIDWSFASLVYIQATMFDEDMMRRLSKTANKLAAGSILILINNRLIDDSLFDLVAITSIEYFYDYMSVFIYRRNVDPARDVATETRQRIESLINMNLVVTSLR